MIRWLKIKFVFINMLIVTVMLAVIFGMVIQMTNRNMEEQGARLIQDIHEHSHRKGPPHPGDRVSYFTVKITSEGLMQISSNKYFDICIDE